MGGGRTGWRFSSLGEVFISDLMVKRVVFQILLRNHAKKMPPVWVTGLCVLIVIVHDYNTMQTGYCRCDWVPRALHILTRAEHEWYSGQC